MKNLATLLLLTATCLAGCSGSDASAGRAPGQMEFVAAGRVENDKINEASGLARSQRQPGVLWTMNDSGKPWLYAIGLDGAHLGRVDLNDSDNRDWEDLASFMLDGDPYLLVADIGDNQARYKKRTLYIAKEPRVDDDKTRVDWEIDFEYPNGPRDAESAAVDIENQRVLILSDAPDAALVQKLRSEHEDLTWVVRGAGSDALLQAFTGVGFGTAGEHLFLVDPLGNLMMVYGAEVPPQGLMNDLKKLLKVSQIG